LAQPRIFELEFSNSGAPAARPIGNFALRFTLGRHPLASLSATARGAELELGAGDSVLFLGRTVAEFSADDFQIV
jgi:hypothetical protein